MLKVSLVRGLLVSVFFMFVSPFAIHCEGYPNCDEISQANCYAPASLAERGKMKLNKHAKRFIRNYVQDNRKQLGIIRQRSRSPFVIVDSVFTKYRVPLQLKYLAVIESELKTRAVSRVGAVGPWQFMPKTAHILGLHTTRAHDERTQYYSSTKAAARYLKDLYAEFGDWLLVLAAYNGGPGPVYHAMHLSGSRDFWTLQSYLPAESSLHVKKFLAALYYFEGQASVASFTGATTAKPTTTKPTTARAATAATAHGAESHSPKHKLYNGEHIGQPFGGSGVVSTLQAGL
jgi:membrane-bound lytic murein transglycosylase D